MSVNNTTFILYTLVYMSGRHVSTYSVILRPSKETDPRDDHMNISWFCLLGGPENDRLSRNMSPWHIHHCIWNKYCVINWHILFICTQFIFFIWCDTFINEFVGLVHFSPNNVQVIFFNNSIKIYIKIVPEQYNTHTSQWSTNIRSHITTELFTHRCTTID